jgi:hypothetical protein
MGVTVVVAALPSMLRDLGATPSAGTLVATGYAACFGGLLMLGSRLGDRFGHRRTIIASLAVFAVGSVVAALAPSVWALAAGRSLQGAAAAATVPSALRLLTALVSDDVVRRRALAGWSAAGAAAGASGFVVGGAVAQAADWRVIFWAYLPLTAILGGGVARAVPRDTRTHDPASLNIPSAALLTSAVMLIVVGAARVADEGGAVIGGTLLALGGVCSTAVWPVDRRAAAPLLPVSLLASRSVRRGCAAAFLNTATTSSLAALATLYLQGARGRGSIAAAVTLLPLSLAVIAGAALAPALMRAGTAEWTAAAGLGAIALGTAALLPGTAGEVQIAGALASAGLGLGLSSVASNAQATDVDLLWRATASGLVNTAAQVGSAIGIAAALPFAAATTGTAGAGLVRPTGAWGLVAATAAVGSASYVLLARRAGQPSLGTSCERSYS